MTTDIMVLSGRHTPLDESDIAMLSAIVSDLGAAHETSARLEIVPASAAPQASLAWLDVVIIVSATKLTEQIIADVYAQVKKRLMQHIDRDGGRAQLPVRERPQASFKIYGPDNRVIRRWDSFSEDQTNEQTD